MSYDNFWNQFAAKSYVSFEYIYFFSKLKKKSIESFLWKLKVNYLKAIEIIGHLQWNQAVRECGLKAQLVWF